MPALGDKKVVEPFGTDFRVLDNMSDADVGVMLLKAFPLLKQDNEFFADLCRIGGFMTRRNQVEAALEPLSNLLRDTLSDTTKPHPAKVGFETFLAKPGTNTTNRHGEPIIFKTYKLLSGALRHFEAQAHFGFEGTPPVDFALNAKFKIANDLLDASFTQSKNWGGNVPTGVPVMAGTVAASWNQVILAQGYQVKDPGAGMFHGEFTHRIQWNAIMNSQLQLDHKPVEIYKALGSPWAGHFLDKVWKEYVQGTETKEGWRAADKSRSYYIWGMIFDAQQAQMKNVGESKLSDTPAVMRGPHLPKSMNYTCPEILNEALGGKGYVKFVPTDPLFTLKVLNHVRFRKRGFVELAGNPHNPLNRLQGAQTTKRVTHSLLDGTGETAANIIWYVTE